MLEKSASGSTRLSVGLAKCGQTNGEMGHANAIRVDADGADVTAGTVRLLRALVRARCCAGRARAGRAAAGGIDTGTRASDINGK